MSDALLSGHDLVVWRGETPVLDGVGIALAPGELVRIDGENGSGKTTLLRVLAGLVEPDEGEVRFRGRTLPRAREALSAALLWIGHRPGTSESLNAVENLSASGVTHGVRPDPVRIGAALDALGLHRHDGRHALPVASLSAGQRRRVALARLALEPRALWILDEPLTALDARGLAWLRERLIEQVLGGGSVLLTTHQPLEVPGVAVRTVRLAGGREVPA